MTSNKPFPMLDNILTLSNREDAYYQLVSLFVQGTDDVRAQIRNGWDFGVAWIYPNPRRLACSIGEKHSCLERARALLVYDALNDLRQGDLRDELVALAVIYHACLSANINPIELFNEVASVSSAKTAKFLQDFVRRDEADKSLSAFMLIRNKNADGEIEVFPSWMP